MLYKQSFLAVFGVQFYVRLSAVIDNKTFILARSIRASCAIKMLLTMLVGTILLGAFGDGAVLQEVDYVAQNYYNGDYTEYDADAPTALVADDDDVNDDYVTTGARYF